MRTVGRELCHAPAAIFHTKEGLSTFIATNTVGALADSDVVAVDTKTVAAVALASFTAWGIGRNAERRQAKIQKLEAENNRLRFEQTLFEAKKEQADTQE